MDRNFQRNIRSTDGGGWVVEYRYAGDRMWTTTYMGGDKAAALRAYARLR